MILYYITDRLQFSDTPTNQRRCLLERIGEAARCGIDYVQLREKDLTIRELEALSREAVGVIRENRATAGTVQIPKLLINSRIDVALGSGADGVHLTSSDVAASDARAIWTKALCEDSEKKIRNCVIAVSCHTADEVRSAEAHGADFAVFAPVFEKMLGRNGEARIKGVGVDSLAQACRSLAFPNNVEGVGTSRMPVIALGGVTLENAAACIATGAAGVAGIRLFQQGDLAKTVAALRAMDKA